jgi:hypothetical protein
MNREKLLAKATQKFLESLEADYRESRQDELGVLHNKMVEALTEVGASPQNTLLVLEVLKQEILQECLDKFFGKPKLTETPPTVIEAKVKVEGG